MTGTTGSNNNKLANKPPPENRAPVWGPNTLIQFQKNTAASIPMTDFVSDPDGDALTIVANQAFPQGISYGANTISYDGVAGANDTSGYTFTASDGNFDIDSPNFRVVIQNRAPIWATIPNYTNTEGASQSINISTFVNDPDGDTLSLTLNGTVDAGITFDGTTLTIGANTAVGTYSSLYFSANDGDVIVNSNFFSITQQPAQTSNSPPNWGQLGTQTFTNGTARTLDISQFVSDPDGDAISITLNSVLPQGFTFAEPILSFDGSGVIADYPGITFTADDGQDTEVSPSMTIRVQSAQTNELSPLPAWLTLDHENQQIIIAADAPSGSYGPFEVALSGADDQVNPITWDAGAQLDVSPGSALPYSSILTDDSSHTVVRDVGEEATWSTQPHGTFGNGSYNDGVESGYWNPLSLRYTLALEAGNKTYPSGIAAPSPGVNGTDDPLPGGYQAYPPWAEYTAVTLPHYNTKTDYFWISPIGTFDDSMANNGVCFVDTVPCAYPLKCHVLDNHWLDPSKWAQQGEVIGTLPAGFSYDTSWGELIYDGTPVGAVDSTFAFRVTDARGHVAERSFRLRVIVPTYTYGPNGTHWYSGQYGDQINADDTSFRAYQELVHDNTPKGQPVIIAVAPHVFDFDRQAQLTRAEGYTLNPGVQGGFWVAERASEHHLVCYTGEQIDRTLDENRVRIFNGEYKVEDIDNPGYEFDTRIISQSRRTKSPSASNFRYIQRQVVVGFNGAFWSMSSQQYKMCHIQHSTIGLARSGATGLKVSEGVAAFCSPVHTTLRDATWGESGTPSFEHPLYCKSGELGRINIDSCRAWGAKDVAANTVKAYAPELYIRNSHFSTVEDIYAMDTEWENYVMQTRGSGTVAGYDAAANTITLDVADETDWGNQSTTVYVRITSGAAEGSRWRPITAYDYASRLATLGDPVWPSGATWDIDPQAGDSYIVYRAWTEWAGGTLIDTGHWGITVLEDNLFESSKCLGPASIGGLDMGGNYMVGFRSRVDNYGTYWPAYGTQEYASEQFWDDFVNVYGGYLDPTNPYTTKAYLRGNTWIKRTPQFEGVRLNGVQFLKETGAYPNRGAGNSKRRYMYAPPNWQPNRCIFYASDNVMSGSDATGLDGDELFRNNQRIMPVGEYSNWDKSYWIPYRDDPDNGGAFPKAGMVTSGISGNESWWPL